MEELSSLTWLLKRVWEPLTHLHSFWPGIHHRTRSKYSKGVTLPTHPLKIQFINQRMQPQFCHWFSLWSWLHHLDYSDTHFLIWRMGGGRKCLLYLPYRHTMNIKYDNVQESTWKSIKILFKYKMWHILHPQKYMWIRMNFCLEEAGAIIIDMGSLIDGQPTWMAFKFGEGTVVHNETKNCTRIWIGVPGPSPTENNMCILWVPNSS